MPLFFYFLGILPSFLWLLFYLRKDKRPESNWMVLSTFFIGMANSLLILIIELISQNFINFIQEKAESAAIASQKAEISNFIISNSHWLFLLLSVFFAGAVIEEYLKYKTIKLWIFKNSELDEPTDIMLYMIIGALGFAAMENIMVLHNQNFIEALSAKNALITTGWRFLTATLLHALCSGIVGFFIAYGICQKKFKKLCLFSGLSLAIILHGLYNWIIITGGDMEKTVFPFVLLLLMTAFVSYAFIKLNKLKSVCLIK